MLINCDTSSGSLPSCLVFGLGVKDQINRNILVLIKECDYDVRSMYVYVFVFVLLSTLPRLRKTFSYHDKLKFRCNSICLCSNATLYFINQHVISYLIFAGPCEWHIKHSIHMLFHIHPFGDE